MSSLRKWTSLSDSRLLSGIAELRPDYQASKQDLSRVWRVGAFELLTAVVFAQQKMREKNSLMSGC